MRIVHIIPSLFQGGAESQLERLIVFSQSTDIEHIIITLNNGQSPINSRLRSLGIKIYSLNFSVFNTLSEFLKLRKLLIDLDKPSFIIQCWMYHCNLIGLIAGLSIGRASKVIWNIRRTAIPSGYTGLVAKLCAILSHVFSVNIIFCADAAKKSHLAIGYNPRKIKVIYNGVDTELFSPNPLKKSAFKEYIKTNNNEFIIGMVGRYATVKGHIHLLNAVEMLATSNSKLFQRVKLVLVGRDIKNAPRLRSSIEALKLLDKIIILDEQPDIWNFIRVFDVLCLPSISEGFPNVVAEAMSSGVPAIVTNVGDAGMIVGDTSRVIDLPQKELIANAISLFWSLSHEKKIKISKEVRSRICLNFSIEKTWSEYMNIYSKLNGQKN